MDVLPLDYPTVKFSQQGPCVTHICVPGAKHSTIHTVSAQKVLVVISRLNPPLFILPCVLTQLKAEKDKFKGTGKGKGQDNKESYRAEQLFC